MICKEINNDGESGDVGIDFPSARRLFEHWFHSGYVQIQEKKRENKKTKKNKEKWQNGWERIKK
ncbi:hypothetical protein [Cysteiniphilum litorale]|uniref:hypothetical protein n=1 Tax=Cysteiniphilum litorale TaxID=2056700 RepID=UPI003F88576E